MIEIKQKQIEYQGERIKKVKEKRKKCHTKLQAI